MLSPLYDKVEGAFFFTSFGVRGGGYSPFIFIVTTLPLAIGARKKSAGPPRQGEPADSLTVIVSPIILHPNSCPDNSPNGGVARLIIRNIPVVIRG